MQFYGIDWLATVCGLTGVYMLGNKNRFGFLVMMVASTSWLMVGIIIGSLPLMLGSIVFFCLHLRGWRNWRKQAQLGM
ncbi:MAG TPA: nicotinamide mononucleotide transporter [Pyrinomonadaceae bacterium]|nr:nicotinamide mononucleotide transporter [Pyrinomonadaceae bacterium]